MLETSRTGLGHGEQGKAFDGFRRREGVEDHKTDGVEMRDVSIGGMKGRSTPVYDISFLMLRHPR